MSHELSCHSGQPYPRLTVGNDRCSADVLIANIAELGVDKFTAPCIT